MADLKVNIDVDASDAKQSVKDLREEVEALNDVRVDAAGIEEVGDAAEGAAQSLSEATDAAESAAQGVSQVGDSAEGATTGVGGLEDAVEGVGEKSNMPMGEGIEGVGDAAASAAEQVGDLLETVAKLAVVAKLSDAVAGVGSEAVDAYADFEQLSGGVETLFGDSAATVMADASRAFETAGLSANEYMETATSSAAALVGSLGGDTEEAARLANLAVVSMADNANKMGTDMTSIQMAYSGFAKGNFTMLDNLKLGYGGTREEMQRLLEDAEAISGVHYDIESYADVVRAIDVIQQEMGIAGTTALEASETISGSAAAVAGAWQNLLTGLADENQEVGPLLEQFGATVATYLRNLIPRVVETLGGMADGIGAALGELGPTVARAVTHWGPLLAQGAVGVVASLVEAFVAGVPLLVDAVATMAGALLPAIGEAVPEIVLAVAAVVPEVARTLLDGAGTVASAALEMLGGIVRAVPEVVGGIAEALPTLVQGVAEGLVANVQLVVDAAVQLLDGLVQAIPYVLPVIVTAIPQIVTAIGEALVGAIPELVTAGLDLLGALVQAIPQVLPQLMTAAYQLFMGLVRSLTNVAPQLLSTLASTLANAVARVAQAVPQMLSSAARLFSQLVTGVVRAVPEVLGALGGLLARMVSTVAGGVGQMFSAGVNIVMGIVRGIRNAAGSVVSALRGVLSNAVSSALSFLGIASPSKLFRDRVGKWIPLGVAAGVDAEADELEATVTRALDLGDVDVSLPRMEPAYTLNSAEYGSAVVGWLDSKLGPTIERYAPAGGDTYILPEGVYGDTGLVAALQLVGQSVQTNARMGSVR